jgi:hypothetical protein
MFALSLAEFESTGPPRTDTPESPMDRRGLWQLGYDGFGDPVLNFVAREASFRCTQIIEGA